MTWIYNVNTDPHRDYFIIVSTKKRQIKSQVNELDGDHQILNTPLICSHSLFTYLIMAEIGFSIASKLIEVLAQEAIKEICRLWNYDSQLEDLKQTVSTIQKMFLDADANWDQLTNQDKDFIGKLKDAVYDAADVFYEFHTRAELNQLGKKSKVRKFFGKVLGK